MEFAVEGIELARTNTFWPIAVAAEAYTDLTLSASPTTLLSQKALALAKRRYSTVIQTQQ